jgi:ATP-dependent RNA helicase DDX3X
MSEDFGRNDGYGSWRDGQHIIAPKNSRLERDLFGSPDDPDRQHTGINFEKYDDIPVDASGNDVPDAVTAVSDVLILYVHDSRVLSLVPHCFLAN